MRRPPLIFSFTSLFLTLTAPPIIIMQSRETRLISSQSCTSHEEQDTTQRDLPHLRTKTPQIKTSNAPLVVNLADCKYAVVKDVVRSLRMTASRDQAVDWDLTWTDAAVHAQTLSKMKAYQKINHFPGMFNLSRKNYLARNLNKMKKQFPQEYDFYPGTWSLPAEHSELRAYFQTQPGAVVIAKPESGCQGRGIFLSKNIEDFTLGEHYVVQKYINNPFLIDGLKFDLRVYVLITGCDPLRVHIYKEGLARFATEEYCVPKRENLNNLFMHLTNYAINKNSAKFEFNHSSERMDIGHKRSLTSVWQRLKEMGKDSQAVWEGICQIIVKTIISVQPILAHTYRSCQPDNLANNMCFELLGFDVMLDSELNPVILEVNYTPSFATDTPLDCTIKESLIKDTLLLMNLNNRAKHEALAAKKKEIIERTLTGKKMWRSKEDRESEIRKLGRKRDRWELTHLGQFQAIYPAARSPLHEKYQDFIAHSEHCYLAGTGGNIKRQAKVLLHSHMAGEVGESTPGQKYNKTDQLERIYMKKVKPMIGSLGGKMRGNRSQVKDEKEREKREDCIRSKAETYQPQSQQPLRQFIRGKVSDSVDKISAWKYDPYRANTCEKGRTKEVADFRGRTAKPAKSVLSRVYNVAFREMKTAQ